MCDCKEDIEISTISKISLSFCALLFSKSSHYLACFIRFSDKCTPFELASFVQRDFGYIHDVASITNSVILLISIIQLYGYTTICLSIH